MSLVSPLPLRDFKDYVLTTPEIAPGLSQGLSEFFMRLVLPWPTERCVSIVTQTMEPPHGDRLPYIVDIDVFRESAAEPSDVSIWEAFEEIRELKNRIFFESLTKRALDLFQ